MALHRSTGLLITGALLCLLAPGAAGDQDDARLDGPFVRLQGTISPAEGERLQARIRDIWFETEDATAGRLLLEDTAAMNAWDFRRALDRFDRLIAAAPDFAEA